MPAGLASSDFARRYLRNLFEFFSSGYLDVSVHQVPSNNLCIQLRVTRHYPSRVSPFGHLRIKASVQLPAAFRCLRVLLRQLIPRHSSYTLRSLLSVAFYSNLLKLMRVPIALLYSLFKLLSVAGPLDFRPAAKENYTRPARACQPRK